MINLWLQSEGSEGGASEDEDQDDDDADSEEADDEEWDPSLATPAAGQRRRVRSTSQQSTVRPNETPHLLKCTTLV